MHAINPENSTQAFFPCHNPSLLNGFSIIILICFVCIGAACSKTKDGIHYVAQLPQTNDSCFYKTIGACRIVTASICCHLSPDGAWLAGTHLVDESPAGFLWSQSDGAIEVSYESKLPIINDVTMSGRIVGYIAQGPTPLVGEFKDLSTAIESDSRSLFDYVVPISISGDSSTVVGFGNRGTGRDRTRAGFVYTVGDGSFDSTEQATKNNGQSVFYGVSRDGSVAVGQKSGRAARWSRAQGWQVLSEDMSIAEDVSADGYRVVGHAITDDGRRAFIATEEGDTEWLDFEYAFACDDSCEVIVGAGNRQAVIWTPRTGVLRVQDWLSSNGHDLSGWELISATDVSADGSTLAGVGEFNGATSAWIATLSDTTIVQTLKFEEDLSAPNNLNHYYTPRGTVSIR